jgi:hypothetical protein
MRGRAGQDEVGAWSRRCHGDCAVMIVTSSSLPHHCCERDSVWARAGSRQGQGRGAHNVGMTWVMQAMHVGSLRAGEGRAHRKGNASDGGGERGREVRAKRARLQKM